MARSLSSCPSHEVLLLTCVYSTCIGATCRVTILGRRGRVPTQIWTVVCLVDIVSILVMISQATTDELFAAVWDGWFLWELHLSSIEDGLVSHDRHLRLIVSEWLHPEKQLVKDDAHAPNVNLRNSYKDYKYIFVLKWRMYCWLRDWVLPWKWSVDSLTGRNTRVPSTSRCPLLDLSALSCLSSPQWSCTGRSLWFLLHHCGRLYSEASNRSE